MNNWWRRFTSENIMMSIGLHLGIVAVLVTSVVLAFDRAALVAPDRIQIIDIDLNAVKVSGIDTKLYNTNPPVPTDEKPVPEDKADPVPAPSPVSDDTAPEIDKPALDEPVPEPEKPIEEKPAPTPEKPVENLPEAPRKKTVVRVNRDIVSLDRTLTVSVVDALRVAMTRCWAIDTSRPDLADIRAVAHLTMRQNGTVADVWFEGASRADTDPAFAYVLETIRAAINVCQPLNMLPPAEFDKWKKIQLTFYPTQGKVM